MGVRWGLLLAMVLVAMVPALEGARRRAWCRGLVRYNVTFIGRWSPENFPKQYPLFRPHAQWSKIVGRTHGSRYSLYKVGEMCSESIKQFSELGTTDLLDKEMQGANDIFDLFTLPRIYNEGVGSTSGRIFLNGKHPEVSLVSKIIPSPDWFVGVSKVNLCSGNRWVMSHSVDLAPNDAGTDQGYTFTAPNWPSIPQRSITEITSQEPHHPANSFFYPDLQQLPVLARVEFTKVAEYPVGKILQEDPMLLNDAAQDEEVDSGDINVAAELPAKEEATPFPRPRKPVRKPNRNRLAQRLRQQARAKQAGRNRYEDDEDEEAEIEEAAEEAKEEEASHDCIVSEWTEWGACSKTCGFGRRARTRSIIQKARGYGRPCPPLVEDELCGSMRTCNWNHFSKFRGFSWDRNRGGN